MPLCTTCVSLPQLCPVCASCVLHRQSLVTGHGGSHSIWSSDRRVVLLFGIRGLTRRAAEDARGRVAAAQRDGGARRAADAGRAYGGTDEAAILFGNLDNSRMPEYSGNFRHFLRNFRHFGQQWAIMAEFERFCRYRLERFGLQRFVAYFSEYSREFQAESRECGIRIV